MREEIANLVYPVLTHGIRLKEKLSDEDHPEFATAQKELLGLLQVAGQAQRMADFVGDRGSEESVRSLSLKGDKFLGIRYALVCWLDEIFILDSPWKDLWNEQSLEVKLYSQRERAWKFWEQADWASARPSTDALEVFYLCVMLGFRGDKARKPEELAAWCERVKTQVEQAQDSEFQLPVEGQPRTYVPVLKGARRLQNMQVVAGVTLLLLIPALMFILVLIIRNI
ncbi:MAG: DotU family type IV/VI secretion system protein [Gemmataceae bacterium]|nr:DotU family type IV/VI secretion system protein [Gemmataceae bacterium]MCI0741522.1 DotU family type IV/VI secretion system protein [Gemmataceae bacterium]